MSDTMHPMLPAATVLSSIRRRPVMYLGSKGARGLHALLNFALDTAAYASRSTGTLRAELRLRRDGSVSLTCDAAIIPLATDPVTSLPGLTAVFVSIEAMRRLMGLPSPLFALLPCLNALSGWLEVSVRQAPEWGFQRFERGVPVSTGEPLDLPSGAAGTCVRWEVDPEIFPGVNLDPWLLRNRLRTLTCLAPALCFTLTDERNGSAEVFHNKAGLADLVEYRNTGGTPLHPPIRIQAADCDIEVEVALQYVGWPHDAAGQVMSYANLWHTHGRRGGLSTTGGSHVRGMFAALESVLSGYYADKAPARGIAPPLTTGDLEPGLCAAVSVWLPDAQFEGSTRGFLADASVEEIVRQATEQGLREFLDGHPGDLDRILEHLRRTARDRK